MSDFFKDIQQSVISFNAQVQSLLKAKKDYKQARHTILYPLQSR